MAFEFQNRASLLSPSPSSRISPSKENPSFWRKAEKNYRDFKDERENSSVGAPKIIPRGYEAHPSEGFGRLAQGESH